MARFKPLSCQTKKHCVVIRKNRSYPVSVIIDFLNTYYDKWALIVHKEDKDPVTHITIPTHYHYVGIGKKDKTPMSVYLNALSKHLKTDNVGIEFDSYRSLEGSLQYLIHKNNPEKTQHDINDVLLGGWTKEDLATAISSETAGLDFERICFICENSNNIVELIRDVGFGYYSKYRATIRDIWEFYLDKKRKMAIY